VVRLHPQALGSLFVASYDSQGYGGGIRPHLHTGLSSSTLLNGWSCLYNLGTDRLGNIVPQLRSYLLAEPIIFVSNCFLAGCVENTIHLLLAGRCLATGLHATV
jgi:hypothetical protein